MLEIPLISPHGMLISRQGHQPILVIKNDHYIYHYMTGVFVVRSDICTECTVKIFGRNRSTRTNQCWHVDRL